MGNHGTQSTGAKEENQSQANKEPLFSFMSAEPPKEFNLGGFIVSRMERVNHMFLLNNKITLIFTGLIGCLITFFHIASAFAGTATLSWDAPTTSEDTTCLTDLSHYKAYYSTTSGSYVDFWQVAVGAPELSCVDTGVDAGTGCGNISTCTYTADGLTAGTWYFVVTARDFSGNEGIESNMVPKDVF